MTQFEPVIGLEVHIHLLTETKIFCSCSTRFGADQNSQVCPICLGMPGVLPVLNRQVVEHALKLALATDSRINQHSIFARKNYFYPDLPKGYQISQFEEPFCEQGRIRFELEDGEEKIVRLTRIHMEEDAGKSMHAESYVAEDETLVDVNRCGVPLLEIVSEPDIRSAREAKVYLSQLRQIVRYLSICDGNMEEGSLRCDANVSVKPIGSQELGVRTEIKNMNSFSHVEKAIEFEIGRQITILQKGGKISQETLLWNADRNVAEPMRSKEFSHDYRYFPEPDLVPVKVDQEWISKVTERLPELPLAKKKRFITQFSLPEYDANILTEDKNLADFFEQVAAKVDNKKTASNWMLGEVLRTMKDRRCEIDDLKITPKDLADLIRLVEDGTISGKIAKVVFDEMIASGKAPMAVVQEKGLIQISDSSSIEAAIDQVIKDSPNELQAYLGGKDKLFGYFVGQIMKATAGKANPKTANQILQRKLDTLKMEKN
jgi:aspartyl-tRNA(Asn)/glutamyl-tRNA(Gln) amidotransferase subunit B